MKKYTNHTVDLFVALLSVNVLFACVNTGGQLNMEAPKSSTTSPIQKAGKNNAKRTKLHFLALNNDIDQMEEYVADPKNKAHANEQDKYGLCPPHLAAGKGNVAFIIKLKELVPATNLEAVCNHGQNLFHWAAGEGHANVLDLVVHYPFLHKALEVQDNDHLDTPLHLAAKEDDLIFIKKLLEVSPNTDVNIQNDEGDTFTHILLRKLLPIEVWQQNQNTEQIIKALAEQPNFDPSIKNKKNKTILSEAEFVASEEILNLLKNSAKK